MSDAARLSAALDVFADLLVQLVAIAARTDPERRSELTKLRRRVSDQIMLLRDIGAQTFVDPAVAREFRTRLSTVMSTIALHQANWPAVAIDDGARAYRQSAATAGAGNQAFIDWTRAAIARTV